MQDETTYILEPTAFHSMTEAQVLTDQLEQNLSHLRGDFATQTRTSPRKHRQDCPNRFETLTCNRSRRNGK